MPSIQNGNWYIKIIIILIQIIKARTTFNETENDNEKDHVNDFLALLFACTVDVIIRIV